MIRRKTTPKPEARIITTLSGLALAIDVPTTKGRKMNLDFFTENARDVVLEAEVNPSKAASFEADYESITGSAPVLGDGYQHQPNKWGIEPRIYFNSDVDLLDNFAALGISVEVAARPYRERWTYRVNNSDFFWGLVNAGYRLGEN